MKAVEATHGPTVNMVSFLAYLATNEAAYINDAVFSVTDEVRVTLHTEPLQANMIKGRWSMDGGSINRICSKFIVARLYFNNETKQLEEVMSSQKNSPNWGFLYVKI